MGPWPSLRNLCWLTCWVITESDSGLCCHVCYGNSARCFRGQLEVVIECCKDSLALGCRYATCKWCGTVGVFGLCHALGSVVNNNIASVQEW